MQLSRDQRAVLEAVYAIEKLPDASLRERLGSYLSLTTRQIQVSAAPPGRSGTAEEAQQCSQIGAPPNSPCAHGSGWALLCRGIVAGAAVLGLTLTGRTRHPSTSPSP